MSADNKTQIIRKGLSVVGPRKNNQDSHAFFEPHDAARRAEKGSLVLVADGMGGHAGGEVASRLAANVVQEAYARDTDPDVTVSLTRAMEAANFAIWDRAQNEPELQGMGTTCTAVVIRGDEATFAHVGDSRAYLVRKGKVVQLTHDHAVTTSTESGAEANVLTRALGTEEKVRVDTPGQAIRIRHADHFILCSDGVGRSVTEQDLAEAVAKNSPAEACNKLVEIASARGANDNMTVEVVKVEFMRDGARGFWNRIRRLTGGSSNTEPRRTTSQVVVARATTNTRNHKK